MQKKNVQAKEKVIFINFNLIAKKIHKKKKIEKLKEKSRFVCTEMLKATAAKMFAKLLQIIRYLLNLCFPQQQQQQKTTKLK